MRNKKVIEAVVALILLAAGSAYFYKEISNRYRAKKAARVDVTEFSDVVAPTGAIDTIAHMLSESSAENEHLAYEKSALFAKNKALIDSLTVSNRVLEDGRLYLTRQQEKYERIVGGLKADKRELMDALEETRGLYADLVKRYDGVLDSISKIKPVVVRDTVYVVGVRTKVRKRYNPNPE